MTEPRRIYSKEEFHREDSAKKGRRASATTNTTIGSRLEDHIFEPPREAEPMTFEKKGRFFRRPREKTNGCAFGCGCGCALLLILLFALGGVAYLAYSGELDPQFLEGVGSTLDRVLEGANMLFSSLFSIVEGLF